MKIFKEPKPLQKYVSRMKLKPKKIGFVPTMGAIHEGHLELVKKSKAQNDISIVSIFVNPKQFNNYDDFLHYPKNFSDDVRKIGTLTDIIFIPTTESLYNKSSETTISFLGKDKGLEDKYRPGHFQGMALIVCKLFNICQPNRAYFGLKDYQQFLVVKQMVEDLNMPVQIVGVPTVRERSGLAYSSRNTLLEEGDKGNAPLIYEGLKNIRNTILEKQLQAKVAKDALLKILNDIPNCKPDYVEIRSKTLKPVKYARPGDIILVAVYLGKIRLIDNIFI